MEILFYSLKHITNVKKFNKYAKNSQKRVINVEDLNSVI